MSRSGLLTRGEALGAIAGGVTGAALAAAGVRSVAGAAPAADASDAPPSVTIAYQPGISYANLLVMKEQGSLEKRFPKTTFTWKQLANGAAIRDGIIANQIQIGSGGVGPFLIGWNRGVGYRLIGGLNQMDLWLVARDPKIRTLKDFTPGMKIGMPGPDAIQAVALRMGAQQQLGNPHALDGNIVAIEHPLGVQALLNGQLAAHLSSPPFQYEEVQAGGHIVFHSYQVAPDATFNGVYTTEKFYGEHPKFTEAFYRELIAATRFVNAQKKQTAALLSKNAEGKVSAAQFEQWITHPGLVYSTTPRGYLKFGKFMQQTGMISKAPTSMGEIELPFLNGAGD